MVTQEVMDKIYTIDKSYSSKQVSGFSVKIPFILNWADKINGKILDLGCGSGNDMGAIIDAGGEVFGVELSRVCCEKYLRIIPHENTDIITYCDGIKEQYDGVLCSGTLEHISHGEIDDTLSAISKASESFLFGIANHSDIQQGHEVHLIREKEIWWVNLLRKYFSTVTHLEELYGGRFFFIECTKRGKKGAAKNETKPRVRKEKD